MKQVKKILSVLMAVCLLVGCLPMSAMAVEDDGTPYYADAPAGENYTISTAAQLKALAETVNGGERYLDTTFTLIHDIDLSSVCGETLDGGTSWEPIGFFQATFDGGNNEVTGLYIDALGEFYDRQGLFAYVGKNGTIKNLSVEGSVSFKGAWNHEGTGGVVGENQGTVENCSFTGSVNGISYVGGVVGNNFLGSVKGCNNSAAVSGSGEVGGVVGYSYNSSVEDCYNTGMVSGQSNIGGVVGSGKDHLVVATYAVINCRNSGNVIGSGDSVGGVIGNADIAVTNCTNSGEITGGSYVGGVVGGAGRVGDMVENSSNTGNVLGQAGAGGVVGLSFGTVQNCYNYGDVSGSNRECGVYYAIGGIVGVVGTVEADYYSAIRNCFNIGAVNCNANTEIRSTSYVGGIVGDFERSKGETTTLENCYNIGPVSSNGYTCYVGGVAGRTYVVFNAEGESTLKNCYNVGTVSGNGQTWYAGGVLGKNEDSTVTTNCYYLEHCGIPDDSNATALSAAEFAEQATFTGWDFAGTWEIGTDEDGTAVRPILTNNKEENIEPIPVSKCVCHKECTCENGSCAKGECTCEDCPGKSTQPEKPGKNPGSGSTSSADAPDEEDPNNSVPSISDFTDVNPDGWYRNAINYVLENGLMSGTGDKTFEPNSTLTRAMLVQILYNLEDKPAVGWVSSFTDVSTKAWYANAIAWAVNNHVIAGHGDGTFAPEAPITREQMAVILRNYARYVGRLNVHIIGDISGFTDAGKLSDWAISAMQWAVGSGLFSGKGNGILDPVGKSTRAEAAVVLMKFLT